MVLDSTLPQRTITHAKLKTIHDHDISDKRNRSPTANKNLRMKPIPCQGYPNGGQARIYCVRRANRLCRRGQYCFHCCMNDASKSSIPCYYHEKHRERYYGHHHHPRQQQQCPSGKPTTAVVRHRLTTTCPNRASTTITDPWFDEGAKDDETNTATSPAHRTQSAPPPLAPHITLERWIPKKQGRRSYVPLLLSISSHHDSVPITHSAMGLAVTHNTIPCVTNPPNCGNTNHGDHHTRHDHAIGDNNALSAGGPHSTPLDMSMGVADPHYVHDDIVLSNDSPHHVLVSQTQENYGAARDAETMVVATNHDDMDIMQQQQSDDCTLQAHSISITTLLANAQSIHEGATTTITAPFPHPPSPSNISTIDQYHSHDNASQERARSPLLIGRTRHIDHNPIDQLCANYHHTDSVRPSSSHNKEILLKAQETLFDDTSCPDCANPTQLAEQQNVANKENDNNSDSDDRETCLSSDEEERNVSFPLQDAALCSDAMASLPITSPISSPKDLSHIVIVHQKQQSCSDDGLINPVNANNDVAMDKKQASHHHHHYINIHCAEELWQHDKDDSLHIDVRQDDPHSSPIEKSMMHSSSNAHPLYHTELQDDEDIRYDDAYVRTLPCPSPSKPTQLSRFFSCHDVGADMQQDEEDVDWDAHLQRVLYSQ